MKEVFSIFLLMFSLIFLFSCSTTEEIIKENDGKKDEENEGDKDKREEKDKVINLVLEGDIEVEIKNGFDNGEYTLLENGRLIEETKESYEMWFKQSEKIEIVMLFYQVSFAGLYEESDYKFKINENAIDLEDFEINDQKPLSIRIEKERYTTESINFSVYIGGERHKIYKYEAPEKIFDEGGQLIEEVEENYKKVLISVYDIPKKTNLREILLSSRYQKISSSEVPDDAIKYEDVIQGNYKLKEDIPRDSFITYNDLE